MAWITVRDPQIVVSTLFLVLVGFVHVSYRVSCLAGFSVHAGPNSGVLVALDRLSVSLCACFVLLLYKLLHGFLQLFHGPSKAI